MLVIGIDPGTAITGFGIIRENPDASLTAVDYGAIRTPATALMQERLAMIYTELNKILLLHKPQLAAVEKLFFQRNVTTALAVGQARGVALLALEQAGIEAAEYTPLQVKQAVAGYGGAEKSQVQAMVRAILSLPEIPKPDDAADALAVAICRLHSYAMEGVYQS